MKIIIDIDPMDVAICTNGDFQNPSLKIYKNSYLKNETGDIVGRVDITARTDFPQNLLPLEIVYEMHSKLANAYDTLYSDEDYPMNETVHCYDRKPKKEKK